MASEKIDEIIAGHRVLQVSSISDLEDSLERNICHTQVMWVQIAHEMSKIQVEPTSQTVLEQQVANLQDLQVQDQQIAEIMEEEMTHHEQVSVLCHMHLQQVEEVKARAKNLSAYQLWCKTNKRPLTH